MKIAMTGANGKVGHALMSSLDQEQFALTPLDLPHFDANDLLSFVDATRGKGYAALIHLAWATAKDNYRSANIDPQNAQMTFNAYRAARMSGIKRVIMASSTHAHDAGIVDEHGRISPAQTPVPDSPYGAGKVFAEAMGAFLRPLARP